MRGYHFYTFSEFDLPQGWNSERLSDESTEPELVVGEPSRPGAPFIAAHAVHYYMPREDSIRAGGRLYDRFERRVIGDIWLAGHYAMLEIVDPPIHAIAKILDSIDGVTWQRLVIPKLKMIDSTFPTKTGRQVDNPTNPDRRNVFVFGDDVANDPTNQAEVASGEVRMVQFGTTGETARVFDTATVLLMSNYADDLAAARAAWYVWTTYLAPHAVPYRHNWRKALAG